MIDRRTFDSLPTRIQLHLLLGFLIVREPMHADITDEFGLSTGRGGADALVRPVGRSSTVRSKNSGRISLHVNTVVRAISWCEGAVTIEAQSSQGSVTFEAPRVLITVPLGVGNFFDISALAAV